MEGTVWTAGGCESWYIDANGQQHDPVARLQLPLRRELASSTRPSTGSAEPASVPEQEPAHPLSGAL